MAGNRKGWYKHSREHSLAARGCSTKNRPYRASGLGEKSSKDKAFMKAVELKGAVHRFGRGELDEQGLMRAINDFERATVNRGLDIDVEIGANTLYEYLVTETYDGIDEDYAERSLARINYFIYQYTEKVPDEKASEHYLTEIRRLKKMRASGKLHGVSIRDRETGELVDFIETQKKGSSRGETMTVLAGVRRNLGSGYKAEQEIVDEKEVN